MRFLLSILIGLLFAAQTSAQQSDTLFFQGGDNTGRPVTGSLGESYTSSQDLSGQQGTVVADGVTIGGVTIPAGELPALVKDNTGAVYSVSADGTSTYTGRYDSSYAGLHEQEPSGTASVVFSAAAGQKYGFDPLHPLAAERPLMKQHYLNIGESYFPAKAITPGAADIVSYKISGAQEADVKFVNRDGFVFHSENGQLTLAGGPASDAQEILAVYEQDGQKHIAGALLLASYAPAERRAVLVLEGRAQVSEADRQVLENSLNLAFGQAGVTYKLEIDRSLQGVKWCGQVSCRFSPSGSARLSNDYTGDEKKIIDFYSSRAEIDPAAVYIFAIGEAIDNTGGDEGGLQGKMHFDKQFGFLYNMRGNADMAVQGRTLAHEIAHGQYKLYHIFDRIYLGDEAMYSPNLMSYSSLPASNELNKMQWDILHDPGVTWGIFARDKDQEFTWNSEAQKWLNDFLSKVAGENSNQKNKVKPDTKNDWRGGVLYVTDVNIGNFIYPRIAVSIPASNDEVSPNVSLENVSTPLLTGFSQSLKIGEFQIVCYDNLPWNCTFLGRTEFSSAASWNNFVSNKCVIPNEVDNTRLKSYLEGATVLSPSKRYVVSNNKAVIRNCELDSKNEYPAASPRSLLEMGREVQVIAQLPKGKNPVVSMQYKSEKDIYCTVFDNLTEIVEANDSKEYKIKTEKESFELPYSAKTHKKVPKDMVLVRIEVCGLYSLVAEKGKLSNKLGWVLTSDLREYIDVSNLGKDEFSKKYKEAAEKAVKDVLAISWVTVGVATCNFCTREALYNLTGDRVLYPTSLEGKVTGDGKANSIISELENDEGSLKDYFERIDKNSSETYPQFWERIQNMVDLNNEIIIGTCPGHVFMVVPGGLYEVVNNTSRENTRDNVNNTDVLLGDKWGGSFARRNIEYVPRVMDCGANVKFADGPLYGAMDYNSATHNPNRSGIINPIHFYKYIKE
jgi:hypothetical protein